MNMPLKDKTVPLRVEFDTLVQVRLTEFGWSLYEDYFSTRKRPETKNGYLSMPLATLMNIFGSQLSTLPYDEHVAVFEGNEFIYNVPQQSINQLKCEIDEKRRKSQEKFNKKWEKRMRSFKAGDDVVKTIGSDKNIYKYVGLIDHLGGEAHEIIGKDGRLSIVSFFELDFFHSK